MDQLLIPDIDGDGVIGFEVVGVGVGVGVDSVPSRLTVNDLKPQVQVASITLIFTVQVPEGEPIPGTKRDSIWFLGPTQHCVVPQQLFAVRTNDDPTPKSLLHPSVFQERL